MYGTQGTSKSGHNKGTLSELRFCTRSCLIPLCAHTGHHHLNSLALCGLLM